MTVQASTREEAVATMQNMMTEAAIAEHMKMNHKEGEVAPPVSAVHDMIAKNLELTP